MSAPLHDLADLLGVATHYHTDRGEHVELDDEVVRRVCEVVADEELPDEGAVADVAGRRRDEQRRRVLPPVVVAWDGWLPAGLVPDGAAAVVHTETGDELPVGGVGPLPLGYHELVVDHGGVAHRAHLLAAPERVPAPSRPLLAAFAPVYALRRRPDRGQGTFGHLAALAAGLADRGVDVVSVLPVLAAFADEPSPYSPASRLAWNDRFVDLPGAPPIDEPWAAADHVDHARAVAAADAALVAETRRVRADASRWDSVLDHEAGRPHLVRFARFMAAVETHGRDRRAWPGGVDLATGAGVDRERVDRHRVGQWLAHRQLAEVAGRLAARDGSLLLDLPVGCSPHAFEVQDRPDLYAPASIGAPPDMMFVTGQNWGLPPVRPAVASADGHAQLRACLRAQLEVAGILRIDHIMGLERLWWIPAGSSGHEGAYVAQPLDELFAVVCLEAHRAGAVIVGEDLGTVSPGIRGRMARHGLLGSATVQFGGTLPDHPVMASLNTHDMGPFACWWHGADIDELHGRGAFTDDEAADVRARRAAEVAELEARWSTWGLEATQRAVLDWLAASHAAVVQIGVDDLWHETRRQNVPGTTGEHPNWRLRHPVTVDEVVAAPGLGGELARMAALRPGRA